MSARLAIDGGNPVRTSPFPHWPFVPEQDIEKVCAVLRSGKINYLTGQEGKLFEAEFATRCGCEYGIAVSNGTVALELALHAYNIGPGDEVIVTPRTFMASVSCIVIRGAKPVFADIDLDSQLITAESIKKVITKQTKAIILVHLAGWACDMDEISALAKAHSLILIEDCAQSHGARYKDRPVGSLGHIAAFSFCQDKIITTGGDGGMIVTNDSKVADFCWSYKDHGKAYALTQRRHPPGFVWLHESFGTNWRLTEMQSSLGRSALQRLEGDVTIRRENALQLTDTLKEFPCIRTTVPPPHIFHSYYKYYFFVRPDNLKSGWTRDRIMQAVSAEGVPCLVGSCSEVYLEKAFGKELRPSERLPNARELGETSLMTLVHPTITKRDLEDQCNAFRKVLEVASV